MGIKLGLVGLGSFGRAFAPLFANHPLVDSIGLCDLEEERIRWVWDDPRIKAKVDPKCVTQSLDEMCASDCDALVVITQPWLHAPQCIKAMEHGKDVYSAVPVQCIPDDDEVLDWCGKIIETVRRTGKEYMLGETTIYRPQTMFCKRMAAQNLFGNFVYAAAEYAHDVDWITCSLREVVKSRSTGKAGQERAAIMQKYFDRGLKNHPFSYPTHSVSGVVEVMRSKPVKVCAFGQKNTNNDPHFANSDFSNMTALFQMENGAAFRVSEMREICDGLGLRGEDFRIFGTRGSYSYNQWRNNGRVEPTPEPKAVDLKELTDEEMRDPLPPEVAEAFKKVTQPDAKPGDDFVPQGHGGSHPYLVHEFCCAVAEHRRPAISAWDAAMYMAMGVAAHKSAQKDGELVKVEDFGKVWN